MAQGDAQREIEHVDNTSTLHCRYFLKNSRNCVSLAGGIRTPQRCGQVLVLRTPQLCTPLVQEHELVAGHGALAVGAHSEERLVVIYDLHLIRLERVAAGLRERGVRLILKLCQTQVFKDAVALRQFDHRTDRAVAICHADDLMDVVNRRLHWVGDLAIVALEAAQWFAHFEAAALTGAGHTFIAHNAAERNVGRVVAAHRIHLRLAEHATVAPIVEHAVHGLVPHLGAALVLGIAHANEVGALHRGERVSCVEALRLFVVGALGNHVVDPALVVATIFLHGVTRFHERRRTCRLEGNGIKPTLTHEVARTRIRGIGLPRHVFQKHLAVAICATLDKHVVNRAEGTEFADERTIVPCARPNALPRRLLTDEVCRDLVEHLLVKFGLVVKLDLRFAAGSFTVRRDYVLASRRWGLTSATTAFLRGQKFRRVSRLERFRLGRCGSLEVRERRLAARVLRHEFLREHRVSLRHLRRLPGRDAGLLVDFLKVVADDLAGR